jgi:isopentenyl-diphosphate delta-isomerase
LIDENDQMIGTMDKQGAHLKGGRLHRAVSVFIFNSNGELLLQQRAEGKYHSAGKWSNTACSHPGLGEQTNDALIVWKLGTRSPSTSLTMFILV